MSRLYEIIKDTAPRISIFPQKLISLPYQEEQPSYDPVKSIGWLSRNYWIANFSVHIGDWGEAQNLADRLWELKSAGKIKGEEATEIYEKLRTMQYFIQSPLDKWSHMAWQLPTDIGGGLFKKEITKVLSERYFGRVLEAMCGYNSYFEPSSNRRVVAMDYCREALERYVYPKRKRILFDLNSIKKPEDIDFARAKSFDAISVSFGYKYVESISAVLLAFLRLLKPGGKVVFLEHPGYAYTDITKRRFSSFLCRKALKEAGFQNVIAIKPIPYQDFYLVQGTKSD